MKTTEGDLIELALQGRFDVIIHGCNCMHTMGAGIAKSIRSRFPEAYEADLQTPRGDRTKLGTISTADVVRGEIRLSVVNAYTQFDWRGAGVKADYDAIRSAMQAVKVRFAGRRIGYPQIGAGLAGGEWERIASIVAETLSGEDHTLVLFRPSPRPVARPGI